MDDFSTGPRGLDFGAHSYGADTSPVPLATGRNFDIKSLVGLLQRQAKLIVATVLVVLTLAAVFIFQLTPIYSAASLIIVDPRQQNILDPGTQASSASENGRVDSEVEIVRSQPVFLAVVRDLKLYEDPAFAPGGPGWRDRIGKLIGFEPKVPTSEDIIKQTTEALRAATSVSRVGLTYLIEVKVQLANPQKAANLANAIANAYISKQIDAKMGTTERVQAVVDRRVEEASAALRAAEAGLDNFVAENVDNIGDATSRADLAELRRQIDARETERLNLSKLIDNSQGYLAGGDWQHLVDSLDSAALATLNQRRLEAEQALARAAAGTSAAIDLRAQLAALEQQTTGQANNVLADVRARMNKAAEDEQALRDRLRDRAVQSDLPKDLVVRLYELQQSADVSRTLYQSLLNRSKALSGQAGVQVPDSRIVAEALPPPSASFPRTKFMLILAGLASLVLGLGLAFLRENYIGGFLESEQLEQVTRLPVISALPRLSATPAGQEPVPFPDEVIARPTSAYSEAMRRARLALELAEPFDEDERRDGIPHPGETVLVTSAVPGEGKTQSAISLARSLASSGKTTLLIDCDLRRPSLHKILGIEPVTSIVDYLGPDARTMAPADIIRRDATSELCLVLGSQGGRGNTDSLLGGARFQALLNYARFHFDYVVLDSSPVLPVVDVRRLVRYANAAIVVVKWGSTSQRDLRAALADLGRANHRNIPITTMLNNVEVQAIGYKRRYAAYYTDTPG